MTIALEDCVILEGKDHPNLLVSLILKHYGKNWEEARRELSKDDSFMIPSYIFPRFLKLLRDGSEGKINVYSGTGAKLGNYLVGLVFKDITTGKKFPKENHVEWLDAYFTKEVDVLNIIYNKIKPDGSLTEIREMLGKDTIKKRGNINFNYWLDNANSHGLPTELMEGKDVEFSPPENEKPIVFGYDITGKTTLYGFFDANLNLSYLGVRPVKVRDK